MSSILFLLIQDGFIYLFLFFFLFFLAVGDVTTRVKEKKNIRLFCGCLVLFLFLSLRWKTGCDWDSYYDLFKEINKFNQLKDIYHFDYGYLLLNFFVKQIGNHYTILLVVNSVVIFYFLYKVLKTKSPYPSLSLYLFYCTYFLIHFMGGNRRAVAIVLVIFFIYSFFEKRYVKAILALSIGFFFHKSAIIALLVVLLPKKKPTNKLVLLILIFSLFLGVSGVVTNLLNGLGNILGFGPSIMDALTFYSNGGEGAEYGNEVHSFASSIFGFIKRCFVIIYIYIAQKKLNILPLDGFLINAYLLSVVIYMAFADASVLQVMSIYFAVFDIILFTRFFKGYNVTQKKLLLPLFFIYGLFQLLNNLSVYPELYIPYKDIIFL